MFSLVAQLDQKLSKKISAYVNSFQGKTTIFIEFSVKFVAMVSNYIFFIDPMPPLDSENLYTRLLTSQTRFQGQKYRKMGGSWAACSICCKKSLKLAANCCNWQMEASINSIISWCIHRVLIHSPFNFQQFEATGSLCSNLPKFAATPKITKICYFEAKWQLAIGKNELE